MAAYDDLSRAVWRTSSYSGNGGNCVEVAAVWRKSSRSNGGEACVEVASIWHKGSRSAGQSNCVEVAVGDRRVAVRDSKDPEGPKLVFDAHVWETFVKSVKAVAHDLR